MTTTKTPTPNKVSRAAIYGRISADIKKDEEGVENQLRMCHAEAARRGIPIDPADVYVENDTSATNGKPRPLYQKMIKRAEAGEIDTIIARVMDRLSRTPREIEDLIDFALAHNITIILASGAIDLSTDAGRMVARMLAAAARAEVERKSGRQKDANLDRAQRGKPPALRCFGYLRDGTINEPEAALVKEAFARFVGGHPLQKITDFLNDAGVPSGSIRASGGGRGWSRSGVRKMLQNRRYIAEVWHKGEYLPDAVATWLPLIDESTFKFVQFRLDDPNRYVKRSPAKKWLGSGLYLCGVCLADGVQTTLITHMSGAGVDKDGHHQRVRNYMCPPQGTGSRTHLMRKAAPIDDMVTVVIEERLTNPLTVDGVTADRMNVDGVRVLLDEARDLREEEKDLMRQKMTREITPAQFRAGTQYAVTRLAEIDAKVARLSERNAVTMVMGSADPVADWRRADVWRQAEIASGIVRVVVNKGRRGTKFSPDTVTIGILNHDGEVVATA